MSKRSRKTASVPEPDAALAAKSLAEAMIPHKGSQGLLSWAEAVLSTADMDRTVSFYVNVLSFGFVCRYDDDWCELRGPSGLTLGFMTNKEKTAATSGGFKYQIGSTNLAKTRAALKKRGVEGGPNYTKGPVEMFDIQDPDGYAVSFVGPMAGELDAEAAKIPDFHDKALALQDYALIARGSLDMDATEAFWTKMGFATSFKMAGMWIEMQGPGKMNLGFYNAEADAGAGAKKKKKGKAKAAAVNDMQIWIGCTDSAATRAALEADGVDTFQEGTHQYGPQTNSVCTDPDGGVVHVSSSSGHAGAASSADASLTETHPSLKGGGPFKSMNALWALDSEGLGYKNWTGLSLFCSDMEATADFYVRKLGLKLFHRDGDKWLGVFGPGNLNISFQPRPKGKKQAAPAGFSIGLGVMDINAAHATISGRGASSWLSEEAEVQGPVALWKLSDPDGNAITLIGSAFAPSGGAGDDGAAGKPAAKKAKAGKAKKGKGKAAGGAGAEVDAFASTVKPDPDVPETPMDKPWEDSDPAFTYNGYGNVTLMSSDLEATRAFWVDTCGFRLAYMLPSMWLEVCVPGNMRIGFNPLGDAAASHPKAGYQLWIGCEDQAKSAKGLAARGVDTLDKKPVVTGHLSNRGFTDGDGNRLALSSM